MLDIGRVCVKIAGRDADKRCVIVDVIDAKTVLVDGETRRRKCNPAHLLPLQQTVELKKGASHADVKAALKKIGVEARETKPKKAAPRQARAARGKSAQAPATKQ